MGASCCRPPVNELSDEFVVTTAIPVSPSAAAPDVVLIPSRASDDVQLMPTDAELLNAQTEVEEPAPSNAHAVAEQESVPRLLGAPTSPQLKQASSVLGPVNGLFKAALGSATSSPVDELSIRPQGLTFGIVNSELSRQPLVEGFEAFAAALDTLGGSMGSYISTNTKKLRSSKASSMSDGYREWILSELPIHSATKSTAYVDSSAWMANIWIAWTLEFFVEMFALIHSGTDSKRSAETAYAKTLKHHHNFFQSTAFSQMALKKLPNRDAMYDALRGSTGAKAADVHRDLGEFVAMGRKICRFCAELNVVLENALKSELKRK